MLILVENVLLAPDDPVLSSLVDVFSSSGKVSSARWRPNQPWLPPTFVSCRRGEWISTLGYTGQP
jgi:hypothetical protein